jgi:hypothetical protein
MYVLAPKSNGRGARNGSTLPAALGVGGVMLDNAPSYGAKAGSVAEGDVEGDVEAVEE